MSHRALLEAYNELSLFTLSFSIVTKLRHVGKRGVKKFNDKKTQ